MTDHQERDTPWRLCWPTAQGRVARARLKTHPEDFRVDETLDRDTLMGHAGEHVCLYLEKTGDNTEYVARQLARIAGCRPLDIGFCGLKDRHAVTRQWFSLHRPGREGEDPDLVAAVASHWPVLAQGRAVRKLRRGEHAGNRFVIVLRDIEGDRAAIEEALNTLGRRGAPNYFGPQRFGHQGSNLTRALALDPDALKRRRGSSRNRRDKTHSERVMYFSAARAWLFNAVLAARVEAGHWDRCLEGEPAPPERAPTGRCGATAVPWPRALRASWSGRWWPATRGSSGCSRPPAWRLNGARWSSGPRPWRGGGGRTLLWRSNFGCGPVSMPRPF